MHPLLVFSSLAAKNEDGATERLRGGVTDTDVAVQNPIGHVQVSSGPYTTTGAYVGADLTIPAGFDAGTYRIFTHIHFCAPNKGTAAGFNVGLHRSYRLKQHKQDLQ